MLALSYLNRWTSSYQFDETEYEHFAMVVQMFGDARFGGASNLVVRIQTGAQHVLHRGELLVIHRDEREEKEENKQKPLLYVFHGC